MLKVRFSKVRLSPLGRVPSGQVRNMDVDVEQAIEMYRLATVTGQKRTLKRSSPQQTLNDSEEAGAHSAVRRIEVVMQTLRPRAHCRPLHYMCIIRVIYIR